MDFDKDNFEEDNELAPLEEEGDADEVAGVEIDEIVVGDDTEDESEMPKRASSGPKRGSAGSASRPATRKSGGGQQARPEGPRGRKFPLVKAKAPPRNRRRRNPAAREKRPLQKNRPRSLRAAARKRRANFGLGGGLSLN